MEARAMMIVVYLVLLLVVLRLMSGLRRRARERDRLGVGFVQVQEEQLDISELVHKVPAKTRRAS
jgi:hypothetical protein